MGFLTLGRRFLNSQPDIIDDRIDVTCRGLLGLTVTCARCHDHKFDPIPTKDYYSLYGVFASSRRAEGPAADRDAAADGGTGGVREGTGEAQGRRGGVSQGQAGRRRDAVAGCGTDDRRAWTRRRLRAVAALGPNPIEKLPPEKFDRLLNRADRDKLRGLVKKVEIVPGEFAGRPAAGDGVGRCPDSRCSRTSSSAAIPAIAGRTCRGSSSKCSPGPNRKPFTNGSGRLDLAKAIADPKNPLTARVFVNRVWMHHFGKGLVGTPSDFGVRCDPPTHPELLDYLADRFVKDGWSVKKLHRLILLSDTYRQRSDDRPECVKVDPENRLLWKFNRQRLDFEAMRDSMLAVAGRLDVTIGGPAVDLLAQPFVPRRTVYGFIDRQNLPGLFRTFDFASPDTHAPQRYTTTVPQQALFLMNSPFAVQQAKAIAARPEVAEHFATGAADRRAVSPALRPTADGGGSRPGRAIRRRGAAGTARRTPS